MIHITPTVYLCHISQMDKLSDILFVRCHGALLGGAVRLDIKLQCNMHSFHIQKPSF